MKQTVVFLVLFFCTVLVSPGSAEYRWKVVGSNPYNGTTEWAIGNSGWPDNAQLDLLVAFLLDRSKNGQICGGMTLDFVTFVDNGIKNNVYTDWPMNRCYATTEYSILYEDVTYTLVKVWKCGNWGGYSVKDIKETQEFVRGGLVQFNCPKDGIGCSNC